MRASIRQFVSRTRLASTIRPWFAPSIQPSLAALPALRFIPVCALLLASCLVTPAYAQVGQPKDADLINRGRYLATAADCAACHQAKGADASPFGGGTPIASPMGPIYASNITPDKTHGIGNWTFEQFEAAMRNGRSPTKGYLYPAMPYTAYSHMSDGDLRALYTYLMEGVAPSANQPPQTSLPFPFIRPAMVGWNLLFLHAGPDASATAEPGSVDRGRYVADALGHCSSCHTPRNTLFGEDLSKLLSGGQVGSWYAPNITPDKTGIGSWSDQELVQFLTHGSNAHAVAGGDMGLAVERSLSKLTPEDVQSLVKYLRSVPPVATPYDSSEPKSNANAAPSLNVASVEPQHGKDLATLENGSGVNGAHLFEATCASCHGANGSGSADGQHPDLATNNAVLMRSPDNLIMTIAQGVHRNVNGQAVAMPGFAGALTNDQIGAIATYVRGTVGGMHTPAVTASDVTQVRASVVPPSWLIRNAGWLVIVGLLVLLIVLVAIVLFIKRSISGRRS